MPLKAKKHKGIDNNAPVILSDLGQINVICGKNNGGKISILEALSIGDDHYYSIGMKITEEKTATFIGFPLPSSGRGLTLHTTKKQNKKNLRFLSYSV